MDIVVFLYSCLAFFDIIVQVTSIGMSRCPDVRVRFGRVKYRSRGRVAIFGCWQSFSLYGEKYAGCFRTNWDVPIPKCVKKGCQELGLKYGTVRKPLDNNTGVLAFRCFQGYERIGPAEIYCDGSNYDSLPPVCRRVDTDISCDFENNDFCKWRKDASQPLWFLILNKPPPSRILNTGPDHDHTNYPDPNGHYIYLETSSTAPGQAARLVSPYLPHANDSNTCFIFWYHMFGFTIGSLKVYINDTVAFERKGNRGDNWRLGKVKLPDNGHFKITVEAVTGRGYLGDIALDDFDVGECTTSQGNTCADRCFEDESDPFANCNCHPGCVDEDSCCTDYRNFCASETTTTYFVEAETSEPSTWAEIGNEAGFTTEDGLGYSRTEDYIDDIERTTYVTYDERQDEDDKTVYITDETTENMDKSGHRELAVTEFPTDIYDTANTDNTPLDYDITTYYYLNHSPNSSHVNSQKSTELDEKTTTPSNARNKTFSNSNTTHRYDLRPRTTSPKTTTLMFPTELSGKTPGLEKMETTAKTTTDGPARVNITTSTSRITTLLPSSASTHTRTITLEASLSTKPLITTPYIPTSHFPKTTSTFISSSTTQLYPPIHSFTTRVITTVRLTPTSASSVLRSTTALTTSQTLTNYSITPKVVPHHSIANTTPKVIPIVHQPVTVSSKDPKITKHYSKTTTDDLLVDSPYNTTELTKDNQNKTLEAKRWISKYKKKGSFQLVEEKQTSEKTDMAGVTVTVGVCLLGIVGSTIAVVLFLRKRRVTTGPCDGAEIVFIPGDELLDFTQASGPNRDSGVYSDTVMSLKRNKGIKSLI